MAYLDDREITLGTALDKLMLNIRSFQSEAEREQAGKRTRDAMRRKASRGEVTGGRVYGYRNVLVDGVARREVDEEQAAVARRIYLMYAEDGLGIKAIAEQLNIDHVPGPRGRWQHSAVREILRNPLYVGLIVYGRTRRTTRGGKTNVKAPGARSEVLTIPAPGLRIIPEELAEKVRVIVDRHANAYARSAGGRLASRPAARDIAGKALLTGYLFCGACGAHMIYSPRGNRRGTGKRWLYYRCSAASSSGKAVCDTPSIRAERIEPAVVEALQCYLGEEKLNEVFAEAIAEAKRRSRGVDLDARRAGVQAELTKLAASRVKILRAIEREDDPPSFIVARAKEIEVEERQLRGELDLIARAGAEAEEQALAKVRTKVESLRKLLAAPTVQARSALRRLQVKATVYQTVIEVGAVNVHLTISGSFAGLAKAWLTLVPEEEGLAGPADRPRRHTHPGRVRVAVPPAGGAAATARLTRP